jgi:hypothetical protein
MLAAGMFRPVQWATVHCHETGTTYRVNGKHTSSLFADYEVLPQELYVTTESYHCDTLDDVARLYGTYDSREQVRTTNDINRAFAAVDPDLCDLPYKIINLCVTAVAMAKCTASGIDRCRESAAQRAEALLDPDVKPFVLWVAETLGGGSETNRHMKRTAVAAAMRVSFSKSRKSANEFWLAVRDGTGATPKTPDRVLHRFLLSHGCAANNHQSNSRTSRSICGPREMYVKCLHAWNAWRKGSTTDLKYHAQGKIPSAV